MVPGVVVYLKVTLKSGTFINYGLINYKLRVKQSGKIPLPVSLMLKIVVSSTRPCYLQPFTEDQIRAISEYRDYLEPNTSLKD